MSENGQFWFWFLDCDDAFDLRFCRAIFDPATARVAAAPANYWMMKILRMADKIIRKTVRDYCTSAREAASTARCGGLPSDA